MKRPIKENENLKGFKRKLTEILNPNQVNEVLKLIPKNIALPLFYVGDEATLEEDGSKVTITNVGTKHGGYVYYYNDDKYGDVYSFEDEFIY